MLFRSPNAFPATDENRPAGLGILRELLRTVAQVKQDQAGPRRTAELAGSAEDMVNSAVPLLDALRRRACRVPTARHAPAQRASSEMDCFAAVLRSRAESTVTMPPTSRRIIIGHPGTG